MVAAAARWFDHVPDALTAEVMAQKESFELTVELGQEAEVLEVDCYNLKASLESTDGFCPSIGNLWHDIMDLSGSFSSLNVFGFVEK